MIFLLKLLSRLPLRLLYGISAILYFPVRIFYRRKLVLKNLRQAFPEKDVTELERIADKFYRNFIDMVMEVIKTLSISESEMRKRVVYINPEIAFEEKQKNKPLLLFGSHQSNWEWAALGSGLHMSCPGNAIYKPLQDKKADEFLIKIRSKYGGKPIPKDTAARELLRMKNTHRLFGLLADQSPPRENVHWAHFFGKESDFYPGLVNLPFLMQATAVFARFKRIKKGHYTVELVPIGKPPYKRNDYTVLKKYIEEMERLIKESPEDYLWTHNRWKHTRTENEEIITFS
jgi:Kdo2-lipid IVA lauroyltransferase/acyltransferase